jgi:hypothetical protein
MDRVYSVTLVRPSSGLPSIEVGAYEYVGAGLPWVGDTIGVRRVSGEGGDVARGYVTRVDPSAETPISVTALPEAEPGDVLLQPVDAEGA